MIKLLITSSNGTVDVCGLVSSIKWSGDYQQCARTLEFDILSSPTDKKIPVVTCELGNGVVFMQDDLVLFDGFIFTRQQDTGSSTMNVTCYDRGIYLKRNEGTYKFTNMTPEAITKRICSDFNITVGSLAKTGVKISRNFIGISLYNIIQTAYTLASESTEKKYHVKFDGPNLYVVEKAVTDETLVIEGGSNLMSASTTQSVADMVNQVVIYNSDDKLVGTQKDSEAIKLYGLLQSYFLKSESDDAVKKAKKMLADNGVSQKITIENLGNVVNVTGGTVVVHETYTNTYGLFYIDSDEHTWKNGLYVNKLVVNFKNIMDEQEAGYITK